MLKCSEYPPVGSVRRVSSGTQLCLLGNFVHWFLISPAFLLRLYFISVPSSITKVQNENLVAVTCFILFFFFSSWCLMWCIPCLFTKHFLAIPFLEQKESSLEAANFQCIILSPSLVMYTRGADFQHPLLHLSLGAAAPAAASAARIPGVWHGHTCAWLQLGSPQLC